MADSTNRPRVFLTRPAGGPASYRDVIADGFAAVAITSRLRAARTIFIKPNLVTDNPDYIERGANTDPQLIEALIDYLQAETGATLMLGESETGTRVKGRKLHRALRGMGLDEVCARKGVRIVNMTEEPKVSVPIPRGRFLHSLELADCLYNADLIINMPKIKTHKYAAMTCALKNMFGVIPDPLRIVYHKNIHQTVADLGSVLFHKTVVLCDGMVAMEGGGPLWGIRKDLGLLLFAPDPLSCDRVAHQIMQFPRRRIRHVVLAEELFGAQVGPDPIVEGLTVAEVSERFEPAHKNLWIRLEEELMRHRSVVRVVFNPMVQKHLIYPVRGVFARLRGGMYTWYVNENDRP